MMSSSALDDSLSRFSLFKAGKSFESHAEHFAFIPRKQIMEQFGRRPFEEEGLGQMLLLRVKLRPVEFE